MSLHPEYTPVFPVLDLSAYINQQRVTVCGCVVCSDPWVWYCGHSFRLCEVDCVSRPLHTNVIWGKTAQTHSRENDQDAPGIITVDAACLFTISTKIPLVIDSFAP